MFDSTRNAWINGDGSNLADILNHLKYQVDSLEAIQKASKTRLSKYPISSTPTTKFSALVF
jgi:hypothetical protein